MPSFELTLDEVLFIAMVLVMVLLPSRLAAIGNLRSDGRPILGLDSEKLLALVRETSSEAYLVPAHAWTPHFAVAVSSTRIA